MNILLIGSTEIHKMPTVSHLEAWIPVIILLLFLLIKKKNSQVPQVVQGDLNPQYMDL